MGSRFDSDDADGGGWVLLDEPELHLGSEPDIVVPDLAGWRRDRVPADLIDAAFVTLAPDWVCEVLSPSTARHDRTLKLPLYAREGVRWLWLLDPQTRVLESYTLDTGSWRLLASHADDDVTHVQPFESMGLEMARLWRT